MYRTAKGVKVTKNVVDIKFRNWILIIRFLSEKKKVPGGTFAIITNGTLGTFIASSVLCFICD